MNYSAFAIFEKLMILLGMKECDVALWRTMHEFTYASSKSGVSFNRAYQTSSGDSATALSNTVMNLVINSELIAKAKLAFLFGDDSLIINDYAMTTKSLTDLTNAMTMRFNFEII